MHMAQTSIELPLARSQYFFDVVSVGKYACSALHEIGFVVALAAPDVISVAIIGK
jgi:hypothetical protein